MYKIEIRLSGGQSGHAYVSANSDTLAIAKVRRYFKKKKIEITVGLIAFQMSDMYLELDEGKK
jgi:hypothetical protein